MTTGQPEDAPVGKAGSLAGRQGEAQVGGGIELAGSQSLLTRNPHALGAQPGDSTTAGSGEPADTACATPFAMHTQRKHTPSLIHAWTSLQDTGNAHPALPFKCKSGGNSVFAWLTRNVCTPHIHLSAEYRKPYFAIMVLMAITKPWPRHHSTPCTHPLRRKEKNLPPQPPKAATDAP